MNIVNLISKSCDTKDEAAREIVTILNEGNLAIPFLSNQCLIEISNTKVNFSISVLVLYEILYIF